VQQKMEMAMNCSRIRGARPLRGNFMERIFGGSHFPGKKLLD
jgi:hypothetical protein